MLVVASWPALAQEDEPVHAAVTGYLESRLQYSRANTAGPVPTRDFPELHGILELNAQIKRPLSSDAHFFSVDSSLFFQRGGLYFADVGGKRTRLPEHAVAALRPSLIVNEGYLNLGPHENLNLVLGKKRVLWGSGQAANPTDLVNPPKDLTDPGGERGGAWLVRAEAPFETWTTSALFAPLPTESQIGLPYNFLYYPAWDKKDTHPHFLAAARLYTLWKDADISLLYFFQNRYGDAFEHKSRLGFSFSRYFFTDYELHLEALAQRGSPRPYANAACARDEAAFTGCLRSRTPVVDTSKIDQDAIYPRILAGTRYMFQDSSLLSLEYLFQREGYSRRELTDFVATLYAGARLAPAGALLPASDGRPSRLAVNLLRRHYAFLSWQKPQIKDDFTVFAVLLADLSDLSGLASAQLSWSFREWVTFSLAGFLPFGGIASLGTEARGPIAGGITSYEVLPMTWRLLFTTRLFY